MYQCSGFCCVSLSLLPILGVELSWLATRSRCSGTPGKGLHRCPRKLRMGLCIALATVLLLWARQPSCSWRLVMLAPLFSLLLFTNSPSSQLTVSQLSLPIQNFPSEARIRFLGKTVGSLLQPELRFCLSLASSSLTGHSYAELWGLLPMMGLMSPTTGNSPPLLW